MDPTANLAEQLRLSQRIQNAEDASQIADWADRLATLVEALDEWIRNGGFLPDQWRPCEACGPEHGLQAGRCVRHGKLLARTRPLVSPGA
jgi:hypothetical protein